MDNKNARLAKKDVQELARDIMLELTTNEIESILEIEHEIRQKFAKVTKINTDNVAPMYYPIEETHHFLRPDTISHTVDLKTVLDNAPATSDDLITIAKVVK